MPAAACARRAFPPVSATSAASTPQVTNGSSIVVVSTCTAGGHSA